jgi:fibronectin type 3 domain-containing protein
VEKAKGYYVYRSTAGGSYKKIATTTDTSYKDEGATSNNTKYQYKIYAYRKVSDTTYKSGASTAQTVYYLTAPQITSVSNASAGVKVQWGAVSGADKYYVYRSTDASKYTKIATATSNTYTDNTAVNGTDYYYKVYAVKSVSDVTYKSSASKASAVIRYLTRPTDVKVSKSGSALKVTWSKNKQAKGYYVYRSQDGGSYQLVGTITKNSTLSYTDSKATKKGSTYKYKIKAYKTVSGVTYKSSYSSVVTYSR